MISVGETDKIRICFVSLLAHHLIRKTGSSYAGGAEVQIIELVKEFAKRGYPVSLITHGTRNGNHKLMNGIEIVPVYSENETKNLNILQKMFYIWRKMKEVDADFYIHQAGTPGITSLFGLFNHKNIVNIIASDADVTGEIIIREGTLQGFINRIGKWLDIKLSTMIVAQSKFQKTTLQQRFNVESIIIKNGIKIPPLRNSNVKPEFVLWISTIRSVKQPLLFLELAKRLPDYNFVMIGGKGESEELYHDVQNRADMIPNLDFKGFVAHDDIYTYYKHAFLLVNTSKTEGFPYVFQEAWTQSLPIVSYSVDPDSVISTQSLGFCSGSIDQMVKDIHRLIKNPELRTTMGDNARTYLQNNNDIEIVADHYEQIFHAILEKER